MLRIVVTGDEGTSIVNNTADLVTALGKVKGHCTIVIIDKLTSANSLVAMLQSFAVSGKKETGNCSVVISCARGVDPTGMPSADLYAKSLMNLLSAIGCTPVGFSAAGYGVEWANDVGFALKALTRTHTIKGKEGPEHKRAAGAGGEGTKRPKPSLSEENSFHSGLLAVMSKIKTHTDTVAGVRYPWKSVDFTYGIFEIDDIDNPRREFVLGFTHKSHKNKLLDLDGSEIDGGAVEKDDIDFSKSCAAIFGMLKLALTTESAYYIDDNVQYDSDRFVHPLTQPDYILALVPVEDADEVNLLSLNGPDF